MKRILCPTDMSDAANNGIAYAAKLAHTLGAELILYNAQLSFETTAEEVLHGKSLKVAAVKDILDAQSHDISQAFKVSCYADVEDSPQSFVDRIRSKSRGFDLIVMGTSGTDDLWDFFFGSFSYQVAHASNVPLLLIPSNCIYSEIGHMVYAFDYLGERKLPLTQIVPWARLLNTEVSVLQVMEEAHSDEVDRDLRELQQIIRMETQGILDLQFDAIHSAEVASSIHSYMLEVNADALALCTHSRNFLQKLFHKSIIKIVAGIADYPVFVFHQ